MNKLIARRNKGTQADSNAIEAENIQEDDAEFAEAFESTLRFLSGMY